MTPDQLRAAHELFAELLPLGAAERERILADRADTSHEVRSMVEELLALDASTDLSHSNEAPPKPATLSGAQWLASVIARDAAADEPAHAVPDRIGAFRIIREIGRGGMGVVYEAEQHEPSRRVALKVIHAGLISRGVQRRFSQETRAMAQLRHPGIAQIYEAGSAPIEPAGSTCSYLVMELVEGPPLVRFAMDEQLTIEAKLELIARTCDAVHHAHQKGVIHRDLKPDNIAVHQVARADQDKTVNLSPTVQPKVLDFGVARLTQHTDTDSLRTIAGQIVGTIPYLSPEQAAGDSAGADVRSDVYSLGVIAFELLSGSLPFQTSSLTIRAAVRTVLETSPVRLGSVCTACAGDVETMVHKAMARDPERRYQSAADFAADIRRFLRFEPILARPPGAWYVFSRFVRRHRPLVAVSTAALVMLVGAVVVMTVLWISSVRAERQAAWEKYRAQMSAAGFALSKGDIAVARKNVETSDPTLRGWEYRHFLSRLDQGVQAFTPDYPRPCMIVPEVRAGAPGVVLVNTLKPEPPTWFDLKTHAATPLDDRLRLWYLSLASVPTYQLDAPIKPFLAPDPTTRELREYTLGDLFLPGTRVQCSRVSRDGSRLAMIRMESQFASSLVVLDLRSGGVIVRALDIAGTHLALSRDGSMAAVSTGIGRDGPTQARVVDVDDKRVWAIGDLPREAQSLLMSNDGSRLIAAFQGGAVHEWDLRSEAAAGVRVASLDVDVVQNLSFNADETQLAFGGVDGVIRVIDAGTWGTVLELAGHEAEVADVSFGGSGLVSVGRDGRVREWALERPREEPVTWRPHAHLVHALAIAENRGVLVTGSWDKTVKVLSLETGEELARAETGNFVQAMAMSPDERYVAIREFEGGMRVLEMPGLREVAAVGERMKKLDCPAFDRSSSMVLLEYRRPGDVGGEPTVHAWDLAAGKEVQLPAAALEKFDAPFIEHSPTGTKIAMSEGRDRWGGTVVYDAQSGEEVVALESMRTTNEIVAFSPDGLSVVVPDKDHRVRHVSLADGRELGVFQGHPREVLAVAFSPDGSRLFTGDYTGTIFVWDVSRHEELCQLPSPPTAEGNTWHVRRLVVSRDGKLVVSGSRDGAVRLWRAP